MDWVQSLCWAGSAALNSGHPGNLCWQNVPCLRQLHPQLGLTMLWFDYAVRVSGQNSSCMQQCTNGHASVCPGATKSKGQVSQMPSCDSRLSSKMALLLWLPVWQTAQNHTVISHHSGFLHVFFCPSHTATHPQRHSTHTHTCPYVRRPVFHRGLIDW